MLFPGVEFQIGEGLISLRFVVLGLRIGISVQGSGARPLSRTRGRCVRGGRAPLTRPCPPPRYAFPLARTPVLRWLSTSTTPSTTPIYYIGVVYILRRYRIYFSLYCIHAMYLFPALEDVALAAVEPDTRVRVRHRDMHPVGRECQLRCARVPLSYV